MVVKTYTSVEEAKLYIYSLLFPSWELDFGLREIRKRKRNIFTGTWNPIRKFRTKEKLKVGAKHLYIKLKKI
jgi:hypothetical protein